MGLPEAGSAAGTAPEGERKVLQGAHPGEPRTVATSAQKPAAGRRLDGREGGREIGRKKRGGRKSGEEGKTPVAQRQCRDVLRGRCQRPRPGLGVPHLVQGSVDTFLLLPGQFSRYNLLNTRLLPVLRQVWWGGRSLRQSFPGVGCRV